MSRSEAVRMQQDIFAALSREDAQAWSKLTAPDFVAYENGQAFDARGFFDLVAGAHKAGTELKWSVTEPRVVADCDTTIINYVNVGSSTRAGEPPRPLKWLESSAFRRTPEGWRVFLVTSVTVRP